MALKTASVLAFERKLNNSDGVLYAGNWKDQSNHTNWPGVEVHEKSVRGTISNRLKNAITSDPVKLDAEVQKPNLQTVDTAALPSNCDTLKVQFTLRVLGGVSIPSACNNADYQTALQTAIDKYLNDHGCTELANRYTANLINGRFLWRNRIGAENVRILIQLGDDSPIEFDAMRRPMDHFSADSPEFETVADYVQSGLIEPDNHRLLTVTAFCKLGNAQEVFPSQELVQTQSKEKSKYLYQIGGKAGIHSQKIGNALRTIDTWHPEANSVGPIAIEPYGSVTNRGIAYRQPKNKDDFYNLFDNWILKGEVPVLDQQHYVVGVLIRGGVFGE